MPDKVIHEIRLNQYTARPAELTRRFSLGTSDSYGVEQLRIVPGEGWDGLMITATFHPPGGEAVQVIVPADGLIDVPPEATRSGSELTIKYGKIVFAGVADGVQRISCNLPYTVMGHEPVDGAESSGTTPSWYEQAAAHFLPGGGKAGQVLAKASDADLDVEWTDAGGGGSEQLSQLSEALAGAGLTVDDSGRLTVTVADAVEADNTSPVSSAAVYTEVGNINALLQTI